MGTKLKAGLGALVLLLLAYGAAQVLLAPEDARDADPPPDRTARPAEDPGHRDDPLLAGRAPSREEPAPRPPRADATAVPNGDATPPAPSLEERWAELGYEATTPPDVLEGMLLDGTEPVVVGTGLLWRGGYITTAGAIPVGAEAVRSMALGSDGVFRFEGLDAGPWYLGVDLHDGVRRLHYVERVTGARPNARALLGLGDAAIEGTVWDANGRPLEGAVVRVGSSNASLAGFIAQVPTDRDGRYAIRRLAAGPSWVTFSLTGDLDDVATNHHRQVQLEVGRTTTLDYGTPEGLVRLWGRLRSEDGTPVTGGGQFILSRPEGSEFLIVKYDEEGRFEQAVPQGTYRVHVWPPGGSGLHQYVREELLQPRVPETELDLVLPGTRLRGRVLPEAPEPRAGHVWISRRDGGRDEIHRVVPIAADGSFAAFGLGPGRYVVVAHLDRPTPQHTEPTLLDIADGRGEVWQDLRTR